MRIIFKLIVSFVLIISCKKDINEDKKDLLQHINHINRLELKTIDDRCGEWGGDEIQLIVYRDDLKGSLLADYFEKTACYDGSKSKIIKSIKRIKISNDEQKLIIETIKELSEIKLNRPDIPSHSGRFNRIMLSDSSIIVSDFPSMELQGGSVSLTV